MVCTETRVGASPRTLIVVRRRDEDTYHFLKGRLAGVRGVEIRLDRREDDSQPPANDRRRTPARFNALGILVVRQ
jgi:hypothetical protein